MELVSIDALTYLGYATPLRSSTTLKSISIGGPLLACSHKGSLPSFRSEGLKSNCQQSLLCSA